MTSIEKIAGAALAGAIALTAVFLLAKPLLEVFSELAKGTSMPVTLIVGLLLLGIAATIFQKMTRGR